MKALGPQHCPLMLVTAAPSLPRYSLFFDVVGSDEGPQSVRSNSKAVGAPPRLTALPSSPIRTAFLGGNRRDVETGAVKPLRLTLHFASPSVPLVGTPPVRPGQHSVCAQDNLRR
jgi:hypothetical protein